MSLLWSSKVREPINYVTTSYTSSYVGCGTTTGLDSTTPLDAGIDQNATILSLKLYVAGTPSDDVTNWYYYDPFDGTTLVAVTGNNWYTIDLSGGPYKVSDIVTIKSKVIIHLICSAGGATIRGYSGYDLTVEG